MYATQSENYLIALPRKQKCQISFLAENIDILSYGISFIFRYLN